MAGQRTIIRRRFEIPYRTRSYIKAISSRGYTIYDVVDSSWFVNSDYLYRLVRFEIYKAASKSRGNKHRKI